MHNAYGARRLLQNYLGLVTDRTLRTPEIVWQHGWIPSVWNSDIDRIVGESGDTSYLAKNTFFVGRKDQEIALKKAGIVHSFAIGLPFAYALKMDVSQRNPAPDSVLVVPTLHGGFSPEDPNHVDGDYISALNEELVGLNQLSVLMNCDDIRAGRSEEWGRNGFKVLVGGCDPDNESLGRLVEVFKSFDIVTTNGFGSPIAYAAASGCRISIWGPRSSVNLEKTILRGQFYKNRVDLAQSTSSWNETASEMFAEHGLYCRPKDAKAVEDWGKKEIGFESIRSVPTLRKILQAENSRHLSFLDRIGLKPVKKKVREAARLLQLSKVKANSTGLPNPLVAARNLFRLAWSAKTETESLELVDSGVVVKFRPESSDLDNLYQHFVERELEELDLGQPSRILDLGSYVGYSILFFNLKFPDAEIVGVEADKENFYLCLGHHGKNPKISLINRAVWSESAMLSVLDGPEGEWSNKTIPATADLPTVESTTLSEILEGRGWNSVDVIKMDIEGSEYQVLTSIAQRLSKLCSILLVKFHHRLALKEKSDSLIDEITSGTNATVTEVGEITVFDFR